MSASEVQLTVNGKGEQLPAPLTVAGLLKHLNVPIRYVAVEVNRELIPRAVHEQHLLHNGDHVEVVTLVGGG
jgi:thiamine biosynthesis protein ThiS